MVFREKTSWGVSWALKVGGTTLRVGSWTEEKEKARSGWAPGLITLLPVNAAIRTVTNTFVFRKVQMKVISKYHLSSSAWQNFSNVAQPIENKPLLQCWQEEGHMVKLGEPSNSPFSHLYKGISPTLEAAPACSSHCCSAYTAEHLHQSA